VPTSKRACDAAARIELTPIGSGSAWKIDDVYVDPWASRG
jgi:hypothetical protein